MTFHSQEALWDSLTYITSMKEMCDVTFHVGATRQPVYGVKSILSARSRIMFQNILFAQRTAAGQKSSKRDKKKLRSRRKRAEELDDGRVHVDVINYDVTVFSQLVGFLHSGRVKVDEGTALGLYCAATEYEVRDLRAACWDFIVHSEDWETAV
nr:hypothetical protein BaRGS_015008 [Batillaria attramentaria]